MDRAGPAVRERELAQWVRVPVLREPDHCWWPDRTPSDWPVRAGYPVPGEGWVAGRPVQR
ncbi:hypothetical protein ABGB19_14950 [Mycobacterium sp. B14F4]|uniref:hypothetical protein n=1 Tax=Mycobacterium sp. B14F4 TaxID=3153565 RepID=UPI00325CDFEE